MRVNPQFSGPPPAYTGQPGSSAPTPVLAPFGERLAAYLVDGLILGAVSLIYTIPLGVYVIFQAVAVINPDGTMDETAFPRYFVALLVSLGVSLVLGLAASYLYHVEFALRTGQTPGKRFMKLYIVRLGELPGHGIDRGTAVKRWGAPPPWAWCRSATTSTACGSSGTSRTSSASTTRWPRRRWLRFLR